MFSNLDPLHSYDPVEILRLIYRLIFGCGTNVTAWGCKIHDSLMSFFNVVPFYVINFYAKYVVFSVFLSFVLIILIVIYSMRENEMREKLMSKVIPIEGEKKVNTENTQVDNAKWKIVEEHMASDDASKWKLAILESDIILSELLESLKLKGEGVGEKLKNVESSDFDHIEEAWEAHKIRNAIAHQGSDFLLTQREAKRVIKLYESVFKEFEII